MASVKSKSGDCGLAISFVSDSVLIKSNDGQYWATSNLHRSFASHLTRHYEEIRIVMRVRDDLQSPVAAAWPLSPDVRVVPLVPFKGARQFLIRLPNILRRAAAAAFNADVALVILPSINSIVFATVMALQNKPFAVQVVGDPEVALGADSMGMAARIARLPMVWSMRWLCRRAVAIAYVTERTLQAKYPGGSETQVFGVSDVELADSDFYLDRPNANVEAPSQLAFCGSLQQHYKGLDVLLKAMSRLQEEGCRLRLVVLGDGRHLAHYRQQALSLNLEVDFRGHVRRDELFAVFRSSDLFVMPSRTEGLPRALIEAMAQGLPAIGTNVGGIPELLEGDMVVSPDSVSELATAIRRVMDNPEIRQSKAIRNLAFARRFAHSELNLRRSEFACAIRQAHELHSRSPRKCIELAEKERIGL